MIFSTQFIILAKRPYRETALLLDGISPDCGRLSLVLHGGQKLSEKSFPVADLFRELDVEFNDNERSTLHTATRAELAASFDAIADHPKNYALAGRIAAFLLKNMQPELPQPYTYDAFKSVLSQLAGIGDPADPDAPRWTMEQCAVVIKTAYLYENGLLPEARSEAQNDFLENLVAAGIDNSPLPECAPEYWGALNKWLNSLLEFHQLSK